MLIILFEYYFNLLISYSFLKYIILFLRTLEYYFYSKKLINTGNSNINSLYAIDKDKYKDSIKIH